MPRTLKRGPDGIEMKPEDEQIYMFLFGRTLFCRS